MRTAAARIERRRMYHEQCGLDRVAQLDQFARQPASAIKTLNFLAQLEQDAARPREAFRRTYHARVIPHRMLNLQHVLPNQHGIGFARGTLPLAWFGQAEWLA